MISERGSGGSEVQKDSEFTPLLLNSFSLGAQRGGGAGLGPENTAGDRDDSSEFLGQRKGGSSCKTKHCCGLGGVGSVLPSKSGPEFPLCILLLGSPI